MNVQAYSITNSRAAFFLPIEKISSYCAENIVDAAMLTLHDDVDGINDPNR